MERFEYTPINLEERFFRLVHLYKAVNGTIRCELFDAQLDDEDGTIEYEALSYTWGGTSKLHEIEVNGKTMLVTQSLHTALQNLRYPHEDRILWIDAICIDQNNDKERGHQVLQMSSIYKRAEQVVIWLGSASSETDLVFSYMNLFEKETIKHVCKDWKASDPGWLDIWNSVQLSSDCTLAELTSQLQEGFSDLLNRSWFERVWIIQEVANARAAKVICGTKSVSARIFSLVSPLVGIIPSPHQQAIIDIMPGYTRKHSWWTTQNRDLYTLLLKFRRSKASDPRDNVYALLGISTDRNDSDILAPDYNKSVEEVIHDTVMFVLRSHVASIHLLNLSSWTMAEFLQDLESLCNDLYVLAAASGHESTVKQLLDSGKASINFKNKDGKTALVLAAQNGHEAVVRQLISTGKTSINFQNQDMQTALLLATENGHKAIVEQLLDTGKTDRELDDKLNWKPLWIAAVNGHEAIVQMLLDMKERDSGTTTCSVAMEQAEMLSKALSEANQFDGGSRGFYQKQRPLVWAAHNGHLTVVEILLGLGNIDLYSEDMQHLLWWTAFNRHEAIFKLLLNGIRIDINSRDRWAWELLISAASHGYNTVVMLILDTGRFNVFLKGRYSRDLFSQAARYGHKAIVELLLNNDGIEIDSEGQNLGTALWLAAEHGHMEIVEQLLDTGKADVNLKLRDGHTPLWRAAWNGHEVVVGLLIATCNIDVDSKDEHFGRTPLSVAAEAGHLSIVKLLLAARNVDVNSKDEYSGRTPLSFAAEHGHEGVVELLLAKDDVDVSPRDRMNHTPLTWAAGQGHEAIVKLLQSHISR